MQVSATHNSVVHNTCELCLACASPAERLASGQGKVKLQFIGGSFKGLPLHAV